MKALLRDLSGLRPSLTFRESIISRINRLALWLPKRLQSRMGQKNSSDHRTGFSDAALSARCFISARRLAFLAVLPFLLANHQSAYAQTTSAWLSTSNSTWGNATNWSGAVLPSTTVSALFNGTFTNQPTLGAVQTTQGIWLATGVGQDVTINSASAQTLTITGNATLNGQTNSGIYMNDATNRSLTIGPNTSIILSNNTGFYNQQSSGNLTISGGLDLNTKALTIGNGTFSTGNILISGNISGTTGAIAINSTGTVTLTGSNNTYTGSTTISAGTLQIGNNGTTGSISASSAITNNGTLVFNRSNALTINNTISGTGNLLKLAAGNLTLGGSTANTYNGTTTISAGNLILDKTNNIVAVGGNLLLSGSSKLLYTSGKNEQIDNNASVTINGTQSVFNGSTWGNFTGSLAITETIANLTMLDGQLNTGTSSNLTISGSGVFDGTAGDVRFGAFSASRTSFNSLSLIAMTGTVSLTSADNFVLSGNNNSTVTTLSVGNGGLSLNGSTLVLNKGSGSGNLGSRLILDGNITASGASSIAGDTAFTFGNNTIQLSSTTGSHARTITVGSGSNLTISVSITNGSATTGSILKDGLGTLVLSGSNTYNGSTTINAGTLQIGHANALGTSGNITFGGGTLQYGSGITTDLSSRLKSSALAILVDTNSNDVTFASAIDSTNLGGLNKTGSGNLTLTANNAYTGSTTISGGILSLGNSLALQNSALDTTASAAGNSTTGLRTTVNTLTLGGLSGNKDFDSVFTTTSGGYSSITSLTLNSSTGVTNTYSGNIANGAAGMTLTKTGAGTQVLSGNNSYSGATMINAGTLQIGNGGTTGSLSSSSAITNNATLTFNRSDSVTQGTDFASVISGTGNLIQAGSGNLILTGANTYNGTTTISAGTLQIGNGGDTGDLGNTSAITNNATLLVNRTGTVTLSSPISSTGNLIQAGSGNLILTGANTYNGTTTISAGTLQIGNGDTTGSLSSSSTITNNATLTFNRSNSVTQGTDFASVISGTGNLIQAGSGNLILTGANTYNGTTTISAGTLQIGNNGTTGSLSSSSAITNNGTLVFNRSDALTINNTISGSGNLLKLAAGNLTLGGSTANTYNGTTTISAGNFTLNKDNGIVAVGGDLVLNGSSKLLFVAGKNEQIANSSSVTINGTQSVFNGSIWGNSTSTGAVTITETIANLTVLNGQFTTGSASNWTVTGSGVFDGSAGDVRFGGFSGSRISFNSLNLTSMTGNTILTAPDSFVMGGANATTSTILVGNGGLTLNGSNLFINKSSTSGNAGSRLILDGNITASGSSSIAFNFTFGNSQIWLSSTTGSQNRTITVGSGSNLTISVDITNGNATAGGIVKDGAGTLLLSGTNTYNGSTTISAGTLSINSTSAIANTSRVTLGDTAVFDYTGSAATLNRTFTVNNGTGTIQNSGTGLLTLNGGLSKNGTTLTLKGGSGGISVASAITGSAANSDLILDGGSITLGAANSYNGPTSLINGATVTASVANALPTANGRTAVTMDATGSGSSTLALGASQTIASLAGAASSNVTLGSNTLTINSTSGSTTYAGLITGDASSALVKNGGSTQVLSGNNSAFTGTTTVNGTGTLTAAAANALGGTTQIDLNGGSLLVTAANAVNNSAAINLNGGRLAVSGNFDETVGALTLSANSTIDFSGFTGTLRFGSIASWATGAKLSVWNWSGTTEYGTQINNYQNPSRLVFTNSNSNLTDNLNNISFYSDSGNSFVGNGLIDSSFTGGGNLIIAVPEPETYITGVLLLLGFTISQIRLAREGRGLLSRLTFLRKNGCGTSL